MGAPRLLLAVSLAAAGGTLAATAQEVKITSDTFGGLHARALGPAVMSGRIAAIDAVAADPLTIWVGAASGGVWKSTDAGTTFKPVFDEHPQSIGAVRVDPTNPKTVWVGTGESWTRNSVSVGDGVYKTTDGGDTWRNVGLAASERIARLQVDPEKPDTVWVCATGHLWDDHEERGVYKTIDGGKSWRRVLFVDPATGCSDLAIDPQEPAILYAGMWQFRRSPDFFHSGGKGSGLYRSGDGGETWERITAGLPAGEWGRVAVAVAPSRPSVVYALVEAKPTALYRSDDAGHVFRRVNDSFNLGFRPFYFAHVVVDPRDHDTVYKPGFNLTVSTDGGKSFSGVFSGGFASSVHSDHHALWIDPRDSNRLLLGTDGGLYLSYSKGARWSFAKNLPVSQFYHVSVDGAEPYNVYGGLQDNSSWMGPSRSPGGIENKDWESIGTGDGFWAYADPADPGFVYSEYQGGQLLRANLATGEVREIKPWETEAEEELRFNWNTPLHLSPTEPGTLYYGAQYLYRSRDRGDSWQRISPDLTTDDPRRQRQKESGGLTIDNSTAENNATIYTISESPKDGRVVWVGTDDGHVQVTRDGGKAWQNVTANLPGVPAGTWVSRIAASPHDAATAFVTLDGHRTGDMTTYLFHTADHGATWRSLATPEIEGYAWVVQQDPVNPDLLFLGTELGLWLSLDSGTSWARFTGGLPAKVAVHDLVVHPRTGDLVIATHGRGLYVLDDLTAVRHLTPAVMAQDVAILPGRPAAQIIPASIGSWFTGDDEFVGRNPSQVATITYWLKKRHLFGDLKVEVYDAAGKLVSSIPGSKRVGLNRVEWPMRRRAPRFPAATNLVFAFQGPQMPEGSYAIKLIKGKETLASTVTLVADPRNPHAAPDRALQQATESRLYDDVERLTYVAESLADAATAARQRSPGAPGGLARRLTAFAERLDRFRKTLVSTSEAGLISGDEKLREKLGGLYGAVNRYSGRPSDPQLRRMELLEKELLAAEATFQSIVAKELAAVNRDLERAKRQPIVVPTPEEWAQKQEQTAAGGGTALEPRAVARLLRRFPAAAPPWPLAGLR